MKESYCSPVCRWRATMVNTLAAAKAFIKEVGYPVIVKPDNGCGAEATYKLRNLKELKAFYAEPHAVPYIMEEFINGTIVSFDGVADSHCVPLFYTSNVFPTPMLDIVSEQGDLSYWTQKTVPAALKDVGFRTIKAFGAKSRFFHCEFFQLNEDKPGLGKKGACGSEVNMRPAGGYTPDMINYANSADCYQIWADMVCYDEVRNLELDGPKYYCVYAGRRDCHTYKHSNEQIMARYGNRMKMHERIPEALRLDMGDEMYTVTVRSSAERDAFIRYVQGKPDFYKHTNRVSDAVVGYPVLFNVIICDGHRVFAVGTASGPTGLGRGNVCVKQQPGALFLGQGSDHDVGLVGIGQNSFTFVQHFSKAGGFAVG